MTEHTKKSLHHIEVTVNNSQIRVDLAQGRLQPQLCYLGPEGSYTDEATQHMLNGQSIAANPGRTNKEVVHLVDEDNYDLGIVAVENSTEGDVMETLRALVKARKTTILGEVIIPIEHMLIGEPGQEIDRIYSHPQALGQCSEFIFQLDPHVRVVPTASTSEAVEHVRTIAGAAAIAGRLAAEKHNIPILNENIGDNVHNATRFLLIGRGETRPTGEDTTMCVFFPKEDRAGVLADGLQIFKIHGVNLTKIDSHQTGKMGQYMFVVSLDGHYTDARIRKALDLLGTDYCTKLAVLGSYKKARIPEGVLDPGVINGDANGD